jgi:hypothetical protein
MDLRRTEVAHDLETCVVELGRDALAPPLRRDVEAIEPFSAHGRDSNRFLGSLGDHDRSGRIGERLHPALVYRLAREGKALRRKDVREGRNRGVLLELGK